MGSDFSPACDIEETESSYLINFDLPGVRKEDIHIDLRDNQLVLSGERRDEREEQERNRRLWERSYGSFTRTFMLPTGIDPDQVEANYEDGVLCISVPKSESTKSRQIRIGEKKAGRAA